MDQLTKAIITHLRAQGLHTYTTKAFTLIHHWPKNQEWTTTKLTITPTTITIGNLHLNPNDPQLLTRITQCAKAPPSSKPSTNT